MAAIPVTIVGKTGDGTDITIVGLMSWTGVGIGGGPVIPPNQPGYPTFPIAPGYPPGNYPSHPIYWPGYPPGWGGYPPGGYPPVQPPITGEPPIPTHPIAPNYPPGNYPSHPIYWPGYPPGWGGYPPIVPPGGGNGGDGTPKPPLVEWKVAWSPETGWVVVGIPQFPHPAPSAETPPPGE